MKFAILQCIQTGRKAFSANTGQELYQHNGATYKVVGYAATEFMAQAIVDDDRAKRTN